MTDPHAATHDGATADTVAPPAGDRDRVAPTDADTIAADGAVPRANSPGARAQPGDTIGRYVVIDTLGAGAMGVVYACFDRELDRKVAVKVVLDAQRASQERVLREAQALARLHHPHVVSIHDVGEHAGSVFLAMEFVRGQTLRAWLRAAPRGVTDIVSVFLDAGHGLAAAHAKGLVHRDFKPDNLMVGEDGRGKVMDFGLARASHALIEATHTAEPTALSSSALSMELTAAGSLMGTPAYMSPEQYRGEDAEAASDQFSYCVALFEALAGQRPFQGQSLADLAKAVLDANPPPDLAATIPSWIRRIVLRGLQRDPAARHPSMDALLARLGNDPRRRRRRMTLTGAVAAVGFGVWGASAYDEHRRAQACQAQGDAIAEVWNASVRDELAAAARATLDNAEESLARVIPRVDDYAEQWRAATVHACTADTVTKSRSAQASMRAHGCLFERRVELEGLVGELLENPARNLPGAARSATEFSPIAPCNDDERLRRLPPIRTAEREQITEIRAAFARAQTHAEAGRMDEAMTLLLETEAAAESVDTWLYVRAGLRIGSLLEHQGEFEAARDKLEEALLRAGAAGADDAAGRAAANLVNVVGYRLRNPDAGGDYARRARMWFARADIGEHDPDRASLLSNVGLIHQMKGELELAKRHYLDALEVTRQSSGADSELAATTQHNLGAVMVGLGDLDAASTHLADAIEIFEALNGRRHADTASSISGLGVVEGRRGNHQRGTRLVVEALEIRRDVLGSDHPDTISSMVRAAEGMHREQDYAREEALLDEAIETGTKVLGAAHPELARAWDARRVLFSVRGERDKALDAARQVVTIHETLGGRESPALANPLLELALLHRDRGDVEAARSSLQRAASLATDPELTKRINEAGSQIDSAHDG